MENPTWRVRSIAFDLQIITYLKNTRSLYSLAYFADDDSWIFVVETSCFKIYYGFIFLS